MIWWQFQHHQFSEAIAIHRCTIIYTILYINCWNVLVCVCVYDVESIRQFSQTIWCRRRKRWKSNRFEWCLSHNDACRWIGDSEWNVHYFTLHYVNEHRTHYARRDCESHKKWETKQEYDSFLCSLSHIPSLSLSLSLANSQSLSL